MKSAIFLIFNFLILYTNAQTVRVISHVDKSGIIVGANSSMTVTNKTVIIQGQKYNKTWMEAVLKTIEKKDEIGNKRLDSIERMLAKILISVENLSMATGLAKESLQKQNIGINNEKIDRLAQEVNILDKDGDFTKFGNEYVFDPLPTVKKREVAFKSDFSSSPLVAIKKNNNYGFINVKGELVIPYKYDFAYSFYEDFAVVKKNLKWQIINTKEKIIFEFDDYPPDTVFQNYKMQVPFIERVYSSSTTARLSFLKIFNIKDSSIQNVKLKRKNIDEEIEIDDSSIQGVKLKLPLWFDGDVAKQDILKIIEGKILIRSYISYGNNYNVNFLRVANYNGDILDKVECEDFSVSSTSQIVSVKKNKLWGFYDLNTKTEIITPMYKLVEDFVFDYSIVKTLDNKYGLIDKNNHSHINIGDWKIERLSNNLLKFTSENNKTFKKKKCFITDASLNCIDGDCQTTD